MYDKINFLLFAERKEKEKERRKKKQVNQVASEQVKKVTKGKKSLFHLFSGHTKSA